MRGGLARAAAFLLLAGSSGCAAIHSYDAPRDINPAALISVSSSVGTTIDNRDRTLPVKDGTKDGWRQEKVLVPDAKLNLRIRLNEVMSIALDPLPPAAGGGIVLHYVIPATGAPALTLAPVVNYLVYPNQSHDVWSAEVPLALSRKLGSHWVIYAGPKYLYQSHTLEPRKGIERLILFGVRDRPDQQLNLFGGFAGFAFGWTHLQLSPEVIYYKSLDDGEEILQVGSQIRIAL